MEDNKSILLNPKEALEIVELVKIERRKLDLGMGPIGEKVFSVFRDNNIQFLYFALEPKHPNSLAAFYLEKHSSVTGIRSYYIAINSMVPLNFHVFHKLNSITDKSEVEPEALNVILQNYDEGITTIDSTVKDLSIFNKKLEDYGYEIEISDDDINEILDLFGDDE